MFSIKHSLSSDGSGDQAEKGRGTTSLKSTKPSINITRLPCNLFSIDDGVGTESFKLLKIPGGAFGLSNELKPVTGQFF